MDDGATFFCAFSVLRLFQPVYVHSSVARVYLAGGSINAILTRLIQPKSPPIAYFLARILAEPFLAPFLALATLLPPAFPIARHLSSIPLWPSRRPVSIVSANRRS